MCVAFSSMQRKVETNLFGLGRRQRWKEMTHEQRAWLMTRKRLKALMCATREKRINLPPWLSTGIFLN